MASPFAAFRKYQKILLAVFGVLIILLFVVGDQLMQITQSRQVEDPVAVEFKGGKLTEHELQNMIHARHTAAEFIYRVQDEGARRFLADRGRDQFNPPHVPQLILNGYNLSPEATIHSLLLARKATDMGVRVSNDELWQYVREVGLDKLKKEEIEELVPGKDARDRQKLLDANLEAIQQEMIAQKVVSFLQQRSLVPGSTQGGPGFNTPADEFAYYNRINQKAKAEVIAIPVDAFLGKVAEPSEAQLSDYFNLHKDQMPRRDRVGGAELNSPEPGFKLPHRVKLQYVKANFADFVDRLVSDVKDEEIARYYEKNKQNYQALPLLNDDAKQDPKTAPVVEGSTPAADEKQKPVTAPIGQDSAPPSATKTPTIPPAAFARRIAADTKQDEQQEHSKKAAATSPAVQPTSTSAVGQGTGLGTRPALQGTKDDLFRGPEIKYRPLSEVKEEIRREVARAKAAADIDSRFKTIKKWVGEAMDVRADKKEDAKKPLERIANKAKDNHMTAHTTDLFSLVELRDETDLGKSLNPGTRQPLPEMAFFDKGEGRTWISVVNPPYGDHFLSWKLYDEPETVPELAGPLKQKVVTQWKLGAGLKDVSDKAQGLAQQAAKELAEKIGRGEPMKEAARSIPGAKYIETDYFSWLTSGQLPAQTWGPQVYKLSSIDDVDQPGPDFMRKVFSLKPDEVGVVMNHPKTMVYVVKLHSFDTNSRLLVDTFVADVDTQKFRYEARAAAQLEVQDLSRRLLDQISKDYQVHWKIPPADLASRMRG